MTAPSEMEDCIAKAIAHATYDGLAADEAVGCARAAIAAMREPTKEMLDAGEPEVPGALDWRETAGKIWRAMIDTALAEKETVAK